MTDGFAATHAKGKLPIDKIFGANAAAMNAAARFGAENIVNATIGSILDDQGNLVCLSTVAKVFRELPLVEICNYAPIAGTPEYLKAVAEVAFGETCPDGYIQAVATAGGTGALHHTIWNYSEVGDTVLTADWFWAPYRTLCEEALRKLATFPLFDENHAFNHKKFAEKTRELLSNQDQLIIILNTPANNPTGYSITDVEWDQILADLTECVKNLDKQIVLLIDIAYIDYAGDKNQCREFMQKFGRLPSNILSVVAFSMSKGYTMYGQRTGAMICIAASQEAATEFSNINQVTSRATWTSINRGCMKLLTTIHYEKLLQAALDKERAYYYCMIKERADIFLREAKEENLDVLPYIAGFFLVIPTTNSDAICEKLYEDNIFAVPLDKAVRIAVCAISATKIAGMAKKIARAKSMRAYVER